MPYCIKCFNEKEQKNYDVLKLVFTNEVGICQGCGQQKKTVIRVKKSRILLWIVLGNVVLWLVLVALFWNSTQKSEAPGTIEKQAYTAAKYIMQEEYLKVPDNAEFEPYDISMVTTDGNNSYYVHTWIKSQNAFGVNIKSNLIITVRYEPENDQWRLIDYTEE